MTASTAYGAVMFAGLAVITVMCVAAVIARAATHALVSLPGQPTPRADQ